MHADRRVARARAAGDEAEARPAGQLALRLGHVARAALVAAGDEADAVAVLVEAVERGEEAFAGDAEDGVDALGDQRLDEGVAGGAGAARKTVMAAGGGAGDESVPRPRVGGAGALRVRPDASNSPFGELSRHGLPHRRRRRDPLARCRPHPRGDPARGDGRVRGHGFGGARMDAIAERGGVDKKLIYYYFAGKDELFLAVLEQTYADIRAAEHELHLEASDPLEAIASLVAFTWRYYLAHPEFLALLNSENMHRAGHLKRSRRIRQMNSPLIEVLAEVLARGERAACCARHRSDAALHLDRRARLLLPLQQAHAGGDLRPRPDDAGGQAARLAHIATVIVGYVAAPAAPRGPAPLPRSRTSPPTTPSGDNR